MKMLIAGILSLFLFASAPTNTSVTGKWKTIDDDTKEAKSIVEVKIIDGKLYGQVVAIFVDKGENQDPLCVECEGELHNNKIIGMNIIRGLEKDGNEWEGDDGIIDPEKGTFYDCKVWVDEDDSDKLNVRGYVGFIYRTQTWHRVK